MLPKSVSEPMFEGALQFTVFLLTNITVPAYSGNSADCRCPTVYKVRRDRDIG